MSQITVETILEQVAQLTPSEQARLRRLLEQQEQPKKASKPPLDRRVPPRPMPEGAMRALHWVAEHAREYAGQWVAVDGDRLIAHGPDARSVYAAADADGAYLPLVTFVEDPDNRLTIIWK